MLKLHVVYCFSEIIFGYKDLSVKLLYTPASLDCFLKVSYSEKLSEEAEAKVSPKNFNFDMQNKGLNTHPQLNKRG